MTDQVANAVEWAGEHEHRGQSNLLHKAHL